METKSFFGENGLTSTSANHYANLAKEVARKLHNYLTNVKFFTTDMKVIGDNKTDTISIGVPIRDFQKIKDALKHIADLNSLIAFFREAISEKERLTEESNNWEDNIAREVHRQKYTELQALKPVRKPYISEEDVIKTWTVGEQEMYLSLEAEAAALGKYIHEDGPLSKARIALMDKFNNPTSVTANGRDTIIYYYKPTVENDAIDSLFFELQSQHRKAQAELNGMKKRIKDTIEEQAREVDDEYRVALQKWNNEKSELDRTLEEIIEAENKKRKEMLQEVQALKIVVPNRLKDIFISLQEL